MDFWNKLLRKYGENLSDIVVCNVPADGLRNYLLWHQGSDSIWICRLTRKSYCADRAVVRSGFFILVTRPCYIELPGVTLIPKSCVDVLGRLWTDYLTGPILNQTVIFSGIFHDWYQKHIHINVCVLQDYIVVKSTSRSGYDLTCKIKLVYDEILTRNFTVQLVLNIIKCIIPNIFQGILISIHDLVVCRRKITNVILSKNKNKQATFENSVECWMYNLNITTLSAYYIGLPLMTVVNKIIAVCKILSPRHGKGRPVYATLT